MSKGPILIKRSSSSSSTKYVDRILYTDVNPKSYTSLILLRDDLLQQDEDYLKYNKVWMKRVSFSKKYLRKQKKLNGGTLTCTYCGKSDLLIKEADMRVHRNKVATIDHIVPTSKGGSFTDENNLCVACNKCNTKKGDKTLNEFLSNKVS